jgi:hypothetical protein
MNMLNRRSFLKSVAVTSGAVAVHGAAGIHLPADERNPVPPFGDAVVISGPPRQRGRTYGKHFAAEIREFLDREIYGVFEGKFFPKDELLGYAAACFKVIRAECPIIADELEGMAEGSGLSLEEHVLITLHEELYHRGVLPPVPHCTAIGVSQPVTRRGAFVGQTWDWMASVAGKSTMLEWTRDDGPSLLAYAFPGLWVGAGLNSAGLALCWTSAELGKPKQVPRIGLPSYVFLAHLLYQPNLDEVQLVAKRNRHAGWFTFVMGDADGRLLNVEGSPEGITCEETRGQLVRVGFGTLERTGASSPDKIARHPRCLSAGRALDAQRGQFDLPAFQGLLGDPNAGICVGRGTIDMMIFQTTDRKAVLSRGPEYGVAWREYEFPQKS